MLYAKSGTPGDACCLEWARLRAEHRRLIRECKTVVKESRELLFRFSEKSPAKVHVAVETAIDGYEAALDRYLCVLDFTRICEERIAGVDMLLKKAIIQ